MSEETDGYSLHRIASNPAEQAFHEAWKTLNIQTTYQRIPLLSRLVAGYTQDQARAAATVIQWLGSPVGMGFLSDMIAECPELKEYLKRSFENPSK